MRGILVLAICLWCGVALAQQWPDPPQPAQPPGQAQQAPAQRQPAKKPAPKKPAAKKQPAKKQQAAVPAGPQVPDKTPEELVRFVYSHYAGKTPADDPSFPWTSKPLVDRLFEPALARAIENAGKRNAPAIEFDPFVDGQDF